MNEQHMMMKRGKNAVRMKWLGLRSMSCSKVKKSRNEAIRSDAVHTCTIVTVS